MSHLRQRDRDTGVRRELWLGSAMLAAFVLITATLDATRALDVGLRDLADAHRPPVAETVAAWANRLGSGGILATIAGLLAIALAIRRRSPWPLAPVIAAFALTGVVLGPLKLLFDRAAPHAVAFDAPLHSGGLSYPSGHAVNAIVWFGVILGARRVLRWIPPIVVSVAGVYLGYHWLTDMLAGLCLGVILDLALRHVPAAVPAAVPAGPPHPAANRNDHEVIRPKLPRS